MQTVSIGSMLKQIHGLLGTNDLTPWESTFVADVWNRSQGQTTQLSDKQVEKIEAIFNKHFSG